MKLYSGPLSLFSRKVEIALREKAIAFEREFVPFTQARGYTLSPSNENSPASIARYFQLYGGYIDPYINKQSPGGPFDSGFFFDSGINRNGGDSPYMN